MDSSASCESQISSCVSSCQHEEKHAVSVEMLFCNIGDGQSLEVQRQFVSVVSSRPNPSEVIETFWLHFRTSHLGMKFLEDLNLLGCDTVWVYEWLLTFLMIVMPSPTSVTVKDDCLILRMKAFWFLSRSGTTHTAA
jgi:saccharopine dehydrogenase-like NADP-dependent oxidoreductase